MDAFSPALLAESKPEPASLPWIAVAQDVPYFVTEQGDPWTPIGQNDAITWPEFAGLFRRRDLAGVEAHLRWLKAHGVTCLRFMLEYCHSEHRYLENPVGQFRPNMVRLWDDLVALCERVGLYLLLTPFDTFFIWNRWKRHPYNKANGGPCRTRKRLMVCPATRLAIRNRLEFATRRWGGSGAVFAWDLWNEMHPAQGNNEPDCFQNFIDDISPWLRDLEVRLHGRAHLQTVSVFGPELIWKPWLNEPIFRHPLLDFANSHFYEEGTIDYPTETVTAAISTGRLVREALAEIRDARPFFDSEHGPIHTFKDHHKTLPEAFDEEYFRHMQWAHFASGAAGGGMRWPNRKPHQLTQGMRRAQKALAAFLPLIDWPRFRRRNLHGELTVDLDGFHAFACGDDAQALVWLLRTDSIGRNGMLRRDVAPVSLNLRIPGLKAGRYRVTFWDTRDGAAVGAADFAHCGTGPLPVSVPPVVADIALAVHRS